MRPHMSTTDPPSVHIVYRLVACKQVLEEAQGKVLQVVFSLSLLALLTKESMFQLFHLV